VGANNVPKLMHSQATRRNSRGFTFTIGSAAMGMGPIPGPPYVHIGTLADIWNGWGFTSRLRSMGMFAAIEFIAPGPSFSLRKSLKFQYRGLIGCEAICITEEMRSL